MNEDAFAVNLDYERKKNDREEQRNAKHVGDMRVIDDDSSRDTSKYSFSEKCSIFCAMNCCPKKEMVVLREYERAIVYRIGRMHMDGPLGPGTVVYYPKIDKLMRRLDIRETPFESKPLVFETADNVPIEVIALCFYRIIAPVKAINIANWDVDSFVQQTSMALLRDAVISHKFSEILQDKEGLERHMKEDLETEASKVGVKVSGVEILNIKVVDKSKIEDIRQVSPIPINNPQLPGLRPVVYQPRMALPIRYQ